MTTCAGCANSGSSIYSEAKPKVALSTACEKLAQRVPAPAIDKGDNAKLQLARYAGALNRANGRLDATRSCQVNQRQRFAKGA